MIRAILAELVRRYLGRALILIAVVILLAAVMGFVDWIGALMLWVILGVVSFTHATMHDLGENGADQ